MNVYDARELPGEPEAEENAPVTCSRCGWNVKLCIEMRSNAHMESQEERFHYVCFGCIKEAAAVVAESEAGGRPGQAGDSALVKAYPGATFGELLRKRRRSADMSQRELGRRVGVSHVFICKLETERCPPPLARIPGFARALGCGDRELLNAAKRTAILRAEARIP